MQRRVQKLNSIWAWGRRCRLDISPGQCNIRNLLVAASQLSVKTLIGASTAERPASRARETTAAPAVAVLAADRIVPVAVAAAARVSVSVLPGRVWPSPSQHQLKP